jgi:hypothetical protein
VTQGTIQSVQQLSHTSTPRLRDWNFIIDAFPIRPPILCRRS